MIFTTNDPTYTIADLGFDKNLVRSTSEAVADFITPEMVNAITSGIAAKTILAGQIISTLEQQVGSIFSGKTLFDNTQEGYRLGIDTDGVTKFYIGSTTNYLNWDGTTLTITGALTATSGTIGGFTIGSDSIRDAANSMGIASTVTGGDDVRFWSGATFANRATAPFRVTEAGAITMSNATITGGTLTIGSNAVIDSSGNATFISMSSLNMKAYTNFETTGRFISTLIGSGTNTFGNQGVTVSPGITGTSSARLLWWITNYVFHNNPSFTCSILALGGFSTGDGRAFIGLGSPTISGSALTMISVSIAGFRFQKASGVTTLNAINNNGDASNTTETSLITIANGDSLELFLKFSASNIKYYYRLNGGTLTLGATHTTRIPTASETYISFMSTNSATTDDFKLQIQCAAYEH